VGLTGRVRPRSDAHATDARSRQQAARAPLALGVLSLAGWAALAVAAGGYDPGDGLGGRATLGLALGLALGAPAAAAAVWMARGRAALRSGPARLSLAAAAALWAWTALSVTWAAAPDLAWLQANRTGVALAALALGLGLGSLIARPGRRFAVGLSAAAAAPVGWAVFAVVFPEAAGSDGLARLSEPLGYWNALALVCALAVPGAVAVASRPGRLGRAGAPLAAAWMAVLATVVLLTYSRGGLLALAVALVVALIAVRPRRPAVAALIAAALGAVLPAVYGLTADALTTDFLTPAARADAGLGLGWRLVLGAGIAAALAAAAPRLPLPEMRVDPHRLRVGLAVGAVAVAVALVAAVALSDSLRDRLAGDDSAVGNQSSRLTDLGTNNRPEWWAEAARGFASAPVAGHGAGGFALVHLAERPADSPDVLTPREPHQLALRLLSGLGIVGLGLLLAVLAGTVWAAVRARAAGRGAEVGLPAAIGLAFIVQAQIDWSWAVPALLAPAAAAAGIVVARAAPGRAGVSARVTGPLAAGLAVASVLLIVSGLLPWASDARARSAEDALVAGDPELAIQRAQGARDLNPLSLRPLLIEGLAYADLFERPQELRAFQEMTRVQPDNPVAWSRFAVALGSGPQAEQAWREVLRLNPHDLRARAELGQP